MSTLIRSEAVSFYAARVRAELAGVDPEVLEDLTDGLEADLTEALLDAVPAGEEPVAYLTDLAVDVLDDRFGTPAEYAAELAQAAEVEIPVRGENDGGRRRRGLRSVLADTRAGARADAAAFVERHPWVGSVRELLVSLRPVWWIARGWGAYIIAFALLGRRFVSGRHALLPGEFLGWVVLIALVLLSIQVGRGQILATTGRWGRRLQRLVGVATGIAAIVGVVGLASVASTDWEGQINNAYGQVIAERSDGVFVNGNTATNLFVYDAAGQPVEDARIVDQNGSWVELSPEGFPGSWRDAGWEGFWMNGRVPSAILGDVQFHQFPYTYLLDDDLVPDDGTVYRLRQGAVPAAPEWPQESLAPLVGSAPAATPEPDSSPSTAPEADAEATPAPSASATPEATATP